MADEESPHEVIVEAGGVSLGGRLDAPNTAGRLVVFAHGSGSSRHSPRNQYVAEVLRQAGLGTLLFDLLGPAEETDRRNVFNIALLAERLVAAIDWLHAQPTTKDVHIGLFGASTGAAAALWAAGEREVFAVVSRGGRPDLAGDRLALVRAPTLFIVGGHDEAVLELNRTAAASLRCPHQIDIVPGATHLFEEPGTLAAAAQLARDWLGRHQP